ncbi:MAG TPA: quinone-dependent dihydroorotate dehydrogenase [Gammaproteobacteria bacterium]|nr:quinone-dependent dihydroorotate dehydrogenase [Gammaproteobacteria bacterium]
MSYSLLKKILFRIEPEKAHYLALNSLHYLSRLGLSKLFPKVPLLPKQLMGLTFPNPVGLAAGFDKNGDYIDALAKLGFGFIEVGTITPKPQEGNPQPRLFRLDQQEALINRLGFNNKGVAYLVKRLEQKRYQGIVGVNIGKNRDTPLEQAVDDDVYCFRSVAPHASYITINVSSPNTPELRKLQQAELLAPLLGALKKEQARFLETNNKYLPLVIKISPDLNEEELKQLAEHLLAEKIDAVIATNTTLSRPKLANLPEANEAGGLSGRPLCSLSTEVIKTLHHLLKDKIPIIASGGIVSEKAALEKIAAGASLVQIYTGLIYQGPWWIASLIRKLAVH